MYLAENKLMGRDEVLKVVGRQIVQRSEALERFLREIRAVASLRHANIVTAYHAAWFGEQLVLAMEYVDGLDLSRIVKARGPLPVMNACSYVHQAALGLQHAHEHALVHRDIKPSNLMLAREGNRGVVKVLDFGLAKVKSEGPTDWSLTSEGQVLGTPDFIAPEQIKDAAKADILADIYSLGATLYYLLTGAPPFRRASLYDILQAHLTAEPIQLNLLRPEVPVELAALVASMMAKGPQRRLQTPKEVARALKPFFKAGNYQLQANQVAISQARQSVEMGPAIPTNQLLSIREGPVGSGRPEPSVAIPSDNAESPHRRTPWLWPAVRIALLLTGFAIAWMTLALNRTTKEGFLTLDHLPANAVLEVDGRPVPLQRKAAEPVTVRLRSGKRAVLVKRGNVKLADQNVLIESGKSFRLPMPVPEPGRPQTASQSGAFSKEPASAEPPVRSPQRTSIGVSDESRSPKPQQLGAARAPDAAGSNIARAEERPRHDAASEAVQAVPAPPVKSDAPAQPAEKPYSRPIGDGFVSLFNGRDLTNWNVHPPDRAVAWNAEKGIIVGRGPRRAYLVTTSDDHTNFHVRVEAMIERGNAGFCFRVPPMVKGELGDSGYQVSIDASAPNLKTGSLMDFGNQGYVRKTLAPAGEWFILEVFAVGRQIAITVNGEQALNVYDPNDRHHRGHFALHQNGDRTVVRFRKVEVRSLDLGNDPEKLAHGRNHARSLCNDSMENGSWSLRTNSHGVRLAGRVGI